MHITTRSSHEGDLIAALLSLGLAALAVSTAGGGRPGSKASGATRLGDPTGGGGVGAGPLPPRAPEQTGTAAGDYPRHRRSTAPGREGSQGQWRQRRRRPGGAKPADSPPTTVSSNRRPSHNTRDRARANLHYNHHNPCSRPLSSLHNGNRKCKQLLAAPGPLQPPAPTPHTRGRNSSKPRPTAGHHQMSPQLTAQVNDQPHAAATVWEALVPPSQLRPLPHSTATQSAQQPEPHQPAGPQMPHQEPPQSLAAVHSKPTALYPAQPTRVR